MSSSTITVEEETQELLPCQTQTLELKPESKCSSSNLEKIINKPVFLSKLSPAAVAVGEMAMFTVKVAGVPNLSVQWFHNRQSITTSSAFTFVNEEDQYSLLINRVETEFEGEYSCTVSNRFGQSTCTSFLLIQVKEPESKFVPSGDPPAFIKTIESVELSEGGQAFFRYIVTGDPLPEVQWLKGTFNIQPTGLCIIVNNPDGSGFIHINNVKQEDSDMYTCRASNQFGEATCSAELLVFRQNFSEALVKKTKALKISMNEQTTERRLYQERSDQMIYTISTEDRQIIPSEEVETLREFEISAASLDCELLTQQAAVLQAHEIQERVSLAPSHPHQVSLVPVKQLHMATFLSSVQERQKIIEQHSERIVSPEILELKFTNEQASKFMSATSAEVLPLTTVTAGTLMNSTPEHVRNFTEPWRLVSSHQVASALPILDETSGVTHRPEEEKSFRVSEGVKILYLAQSTGQLPITEGHSEPLPALDAATKTLIEKEPPKPAVAPMSQTRMALSKEQPFEIYIPARQIISSCKDELCKSAVTAEEKYELQSEEARLLPGIASSSCLQPLREGQRLLNLQLISDQDVFQSEGRFSSKKPSIEQADDRNSPILLHSVSQEEQRIMVCQATSEFSAKTDTESVQPKKEPPPAQYIQSVESLLVLPKEGILTFTKNDQQVVTQKEEKARRHAALSEERREIIADLHNNLDVPLPTVQLQLQTEPRPSSIFTISSQPMQLPKEKPLVTDIKQQRALVQKEDYWNIMHSLNVTDNQALEEGHTTSLKADEKVNSRLKFEPKIPKKPIFIEEKAVATERCSVLEAAEQDFAVQVQEGQSVRQSVLLEEKQVISGEQSSEIYKPEGSAVSSTTQPKGVLFVHEFLDSQTLPKELHFVVQIPKPSSLNIRRQLRDTLQSAMASYQPVLLADVLGRLEMVEVQEMKVQREPKQTMYTYLITTPDAPVEITLSFQGDYPQTADLRSELQVALHALVSQEHQSLISEQPGTMQIDLPQRALSSSALSKEVLSSVVDTVTLAGSATGFPPLELESAAITMEAEVPSLQNTVVQILSETVEYKQVNRKTVKSGWDAAAAAATADVPVGQIPVGHVDMFVHRESREDFLSEAVMISESSDSLLDYPVVVDSLEDICVEENNKAVFTTNIKYITRVNWFCNGQLVQSGKEFMCSKDKDTCKLVIHKVVKEKHQGEFVCEAENEAGKTATSSRLLVVSRGLMMGKSLKSSSTNLKHCLMSCCLQTSNKQVVLIICLVFF